MDQLKEIEFEKCCEEYMPIVKSLVRKWNLKWEQEDYIQIGRIALYDAWCKYDPKHGPFAPYAKSYVSGRLKKALCKQDRWRTQHVSIEPVILSEMTPALRYDEDQILITDWLNRSNLSDREKLWVKEALFHGYKPQEIAIIYGVNVETVKSWRKKALEKLSKLPRSQSYEKSHL